MPELRISREDDAPPTQRDLLEAGLNEHARPFEAGQEPRPLQFYVRDARGEIVAGLSGGLYDAYVYISLVWVHESLRGTGYGTRLMDLAEDAAREHGCSEAHLSTLSFQARPFYEQRGYVVTGSRPYGNDHQRYFLKKVL